jgi:hypothetical protein
LPYPREVIACPNCEATEQTDAETLSGSFGGDSQTAWSLALLVEALERALTLGRVADAERLVRRATARVEELVAAGGPIDPKALASLALQAAATTQVTNDPTWGLWIFDAYRRTGTVPPLEVVERLWDIVGKYPGIVRPGLGALLEHFRAGGKSAASTAEVEVLARLEQMRRLLDDTAVHGTDVTGDWPGAS